MLDELEFGKECEGIEEDEKICESSSEFKVLYQRVKESYRNKGRELAKKKGITDEDQIQNFAEQYMEMEAEYWIALFYAGYEKGELTQSEIVDTMKCDTSNAEWFFEEFEDLAKTTAVRKKVQNLSLYQENEGWKIDFSVLKTEFINFNLEGIIKLDDSKRKMIKETKEKIEEERAQIEECERCIDKMEQTIREIEEELQASKKVKQEYVMQFMKERQKQMSQENVLTSQAEIIPDFPWNWLHTKVE